MKRLNPKIFAQPDLLRSIQPENLIRLLEPCRDLLESHGLPVPLEKGAEIDSLEINGVLARPDEWLDPHVVEGLHVIGNLGNDENFDELLDIARRNFIEVDMEATAADVAARIWVEAPRALELKVREAGSHRHRKFESFRARDPQSTLPVAQLPTEFGPLEADLEGWFTAHKRGVGCRVIRQDIEGEVRFLVQHGQPCKREPSRTGRQSTCTFFRPEKTDLVVYDPLNNELRMSTDTIGEMRLYREKFGKHLFGDPEKFIYAHKPEMLARGQWRSEAPGDGETAGFWINGLYSPWTTWGQLAKDFLRARKSPERMQTFTNTVLAETFQQAGATKTDASELLGRRQAYRPDITLPAGVVLITLGADLQGDRIELEIVGWGRDEESWSLAYIVLAGDPAQRDLWDAFDQVLSLRFDHPCGRELEVAVACVDSGFHQSIVQTFCGERQRRSASPKMYPIKGAAGQRPIWPRMHSKAKDNRPLWVIGVDAAKEALYARLKITEAGPGFCHFPVSDQYDIGYFEQLTAETCRVRYSKGFAHREWIKKTGVRNEGLDARCYAYAALQSLIAGRFRLNKQAEQIEAMVAAKSSGEDAERSPGARPVPPRPPPNGSGREPWIERRDWFTR